MKRIVFLLLLFGFFHLAALGQDYGSVKGKKVYRSLEEALANKNDVYNLRLYRFKWEDLQLIATLKQLQYLALENGKLDSLPEAICSLPDIRTLNLCGNKFTKIPEGVRRMKQLDYLVMYDNEIREVPAWIGELTNLKTLILVRNKIDSISPGIGRLHKLSDFAVNNNMLRHLPKEIGELRSLRELSADGNQLTQLPEEITRLKNLETLEVNSNYLSSLPEELGKCSKLARVQASSNRLTSLPASLSRLRELKSLVLENNSFDSSIEHFVFPMRLEHLELTGKAIHQIPISLQHCKDLQHIKITHTSIASIPNWLNELKAINWLELNNNQLTVIHDLPDLHKLRVFRVSGNLLDTVPGNILLLPALETADISNNPITHIPVEIQHAAKLTWLSIYSTWISNTEYMAYKRLVGKHIALPHDKIVFFEDEDRPCYIDGLLDTSEVFTHMEVNPHFIKGHQAWQNFAVDHLRKNKVAGVQDSVVLRYIVRDEGGFSNLQVVHYKFEQTRDEAVYLMKLSCPYWVPASISGRRVNLWRRQVFIFDGEGIKVGDHPNDP
ncbi:leucine-rich repeat domain-containing protein [Chitinophaga agrisoli]|nr:leucine-rich repeat domain-containing protein [Chitinophaga agrisoli]